MLDRSCVTLSHEIEKITNELCCLSSDIGDPLANGPCCNCLMRQIQPNHCNRPVFAEDDVGGLGVGVDIELGDWSDVPVRICTAHEYHLTHPGHDLWMCPRG